MLPLQKAEKGDDMNLEITTLPFAELYGTPLEHFESFVSVL